MTLEALLRDRMATLGLSQAATARAAEIKGSVYSKILVGALRLPSDAALRLALVLNLDARVLMSLSTPKRNFLRAAR